MTAKFAFIPDRREMAKSVMWELYRQSRESVLNYVYCKPLLGSQSISSVGCQTCGKTKRNTHKKEIKRNGFKFGVCESTYEFCEASGSEKKKNERKPLSFQRQQPKNKQTNKQTNRCFCDHVGEHFSKNESFVSLASPSSLRFSTHSFCNCLFPKCSSIENQFVCLRLWPLCSYVLSRLAGSCTLQLIVEDSVAGPAENAKIDVIFQNTWISSSSSNLERFFEC